MRKKVELAPFAVTSDGTIFVNLARLTATTDLEAIVRAAKEETRAVLVAARVSPDEAEFVMARLDNAADETAAWIVGQRRRRARPRDTRPSKK